MASSPSAAFLRLRVFIQSVTMVCLQPAEARGRRHNHRSAELALKQTSAAPAALPATP